MCHLDVILWKRWFRIKGKAAAYVTQVGALWMRWGMTGIKRDNRTLRLLHQAALWVFLLFSIWVLPKKIYFHCLALNIRFKKPMKQLLVCVFKEQPWQPQAVKQASSVVLTLLGTWRQQNKHPRQDVLQEGGAGAEKLKGSERIRPQTIVEELAVAQWSKLHPGGDDECAER